MANSVPDTNTFSLQDVVNVVSGSSLIAAFTNSVDAYFDPTYKGSKDRLSNFRNYSELILCDTPVSYTGGTSYPTETLINLGSNTGTVRFDFAAYSVPDLFIIEYDNGIVIDTGYSGSTQYDYGNSYRGQFNSALNGRADPHGGTYPDISKYPDDGYPRVSSIDGTVYWSKNNTITTAKVSVYAPMDGTVWDFTLYCPS